MGSVSLYFVSERRIQVEKTLHVRQKNNLARKYICPRKEKT